MEKLNRFHYFLISLVAALSVVIVVLLLDRHPSDPAGEGILCESMEGKAIHIHAQLQLWRNGESIQIPANVGNAPGCFYWLHTHTADGVIHVESPKIRDFSLADFFAIWGKNPLGNKASIADEPGIRVWSKQSGEKDFHELKGYWGDLVFSDHQVIAMGTGQYTPSDFAFPDNL